MGARAWGERVFGAPPPRDAPRLARLRWVRGFYVKPLPLDVLACAMLAFWVGGALAVVLAALAAATWMLGFVALNLQIARERRRQRPPRA